MQEIEKTQTLKPIKPVRWALYAFLASIPLIGLILLLVWSFGDGERIEKRNWARGRLLLMLIFCAVWIVCITLLLLLGGRSLYRLFGREFFY